MAIDWNGATDGLFTNIGFRVAAFNTAANDARVTLTNELFGLNEKTSNSNCENRTLLNHQTDQAYRDMQRAKLTFARQNAALIDLRLQDRPTVLNELKLANGDLNRLIPRLIDQMKAETQTVLKSTVTVGSVTADGDNVGNGTILIDKQLDGVTPPSHDMPASIWYSGVDSELAASETITVVCTRDAQGAMADSAPLRGEVVAQDRMFVEGDEEFWVYGQNSSTEQDGTGGPIIGVTAVEGSGPGPIFKTLNSYELIFNPNFETYDGVNTPTNWDDATLGSAGSHIQKDTTNFYRGKAAVKFVADGSIATIRIGQKVPARLLVGKKRYYFSIRCRSSGTHTAGTFETFFTGTGYTAAASEKVSIAFGSAPGASFVRYGFYWTTPATIPGDLYLYIQWSGTPNSGATYTFDDVAFGPVTYHGGVNVVAISGSTAWKIGDKATCPLTNDGAGKFQQFWRRRYRMQLPSSATPSIADALVTTAVPSDVTGTGSI